MSPPKPKPDKSPSPRPKTPKITPTNSKNGAPTISPTKSATALGATTPKSLKKPEPSLLGDFLLGRPSPQRVAAQRSASKRRKTMSMDAQNVREELRQEMRAAAVRKLQQPGGVRDRVKAWQKASQAAVKAEGLPIPVAEDARSEPTEFAVNLSGDDVDEEDRMRIKWRQKPPKKKKPKIETVEPKGTSGSDSTAKEKIKVLGKLADDKPDVIIKEARPRPEDWAQRVELPPPPPPVARRPTVKTYRHAKTGETVTVEEEEDDDHHRGALSEPDMPRRKRSSSGESRRSNSNPRTQQCPPNDGIRVRSLQKRGSKDDGIRICPAKPARSLPDDGIKVRPGPPVSADSSSRGASPPPRRTSTPPRRASTPLRKASTPKPRARSDHSAASDDVIEVIVEPESEVPPPPKRKLPRRRGSRGGARRKPKRRSPSPPTTATQTETTTDDRRPGADKPMPTPRNGGSSGEDSDRRPPTAAGIDDLAEIPFGFSAFSELELPLRGNTQRTHARQSAKPKPKPQRNESLKLVPNVLKKVMTGAMEKMQEMAEPPRPPPTGNKPARIESWLNNTVDPFVEGMPNLPPVVAPEPLRVSTPERNSKEKLVDRDLPAHRERAPERNSKEKLVDRDVSTHKARTHEISKRASAELPRRKERPQTPVTHEELRKTSTRSDDSEVTPKRRKSPTTTPDSAAGLKRHSTPRSPTLPRRSSGSVKKPFRDVLKEAFKGESSAHKIAPMVYPSCETDVESEPETEDDLESRRSPPQQRSPDSYKRRSASPDRPSRADSYSSSEPSTRGPSRRRRPTSDLHDLSTILSEDSREYQEPYGKKDTDSVSTVSQSTVTQAPEEAFGQPTPLTREASQQSQTSQISRKSGSLKRRLTTKHSDLVSVLSLPDDGQLVPPSRSRSIKASRSLHRKPSKATDSRVNDLLEEFADDEHFYHRELKTLVDGVVPVLLNEFVHGDNVDDADRKTDSMAKAVVNMGVALEKLWTYHKRAPLHDIRRLLEWLEAVSPVYNNYLDVWRLGFQDLIVNLAPPSGKIDENDSLLNALPRNEDGDVLSYNGERVDVAYLLKRPLIRIKWMYKFLRAAVMVIKTPETEDLLKLYGNLQEKARTRHREEFARITDEDANNTDTTRARDLRNLRPLDNVRIDPSRQVAAKDSFEMDLEHSSGQRLECQIELMHRDRVNVPSDMGDILIRDISNKAKPWLLFPPVPRQYISARKGESPRSMIVMIRGRHNGDEWYELIKLSTTEEVQITDWLGILGSDPMPPLSRPKPPMSMSLIHVSSPKADDLDVPIGEPSVIGSYDDEVRTPSRYHKRQASAPVTSYPAPNKHIPYSESVDIFRSQPITPAYGIESVPIPRPLNIKGSAAVQPPVELGPTTRVKRRTSSPLKHEYHPSDIDSETEESARSDSESSSSSSDELDEDDVPDTIPGYSLKQPLPQIVEESVVSENTIAPSQSASQVGAPQPGQQTPQERTVQRFVASVSYWSNRKGIWREINTEPSRILVFPGSMEVHMLQETPGNKQAYPLQTSGTSEVDMANREAGGIVPLICLILTPVVMIRRSTALDLEVRSRVSPESRLSSIDSGMFRFRAASQDEAKALYEAVHQSRLNNARYIQLAEEARVRSFGQQIQNDSGAGSADGTETSSRRKSIFGRKNSYRASTRAPSQHSSATTSVSAKSFLRRLLGGENTSFNIGKSTVDKQSRPGSIAGSGGAHGGGSGSLYSSGYSSGTGGNDSSTPPRSASGSGSQSPSRWSIGLAKPFTPGQPLEIRCHLNVQNNRWADKGDCILHIGRPPPGVRQELSLYHGLEKRIIVTHATKKVSDKPLILLDAVLGSKSFSMLGTKGIMCSVWENLRDEEGNVGLAPRTGRVAGKVTKWCFQCKSVQQANWVFGMVTSEVEGLLL
ncbi:hypothetical protein NEUTE1DRAFT_58434 [Neurospora tetrasperma FGSC 2508]|uniref:Uncharacterized protein n=1 Tax=Neurospora tetrasperma (strain FGSC 2508 / ATCC MYA-4615 / P0657) TaxID=510951 RepID=F8MC90_NEUT8|nr:uncharacterized protein NEUTE1DRAFT_58434 [Neurospora tetrasperma FGSC 2508]EGO61245.1 hypothetical protein NEUTE1DRAFT_58434 [Neurospora tetrasperma FGSC 2508]